MQQRLPYQAGVLSFVRMNFHLLEALQVFAAGMWVDESEEVLPLRYFRPK